MSWAVAARVLPAVLLLPLGGPLARLLLGLGVAALLSSWLPPPPAPGLAAVAGELALGAMLGLLAAVPAWAGEALRGDGPPALGFAGQVLAWAVFFGVGGPGLLLVALGESFGALPAAAWPDAAAVARGTGTLFYAGLVLGLPAWLSGLVVGPLAGLLDRLAGAPTGTATLGLVRPLVFVLLLAAALPWLLDEMRGLWLAALSRG